MKKTVYFKGYYGFKNIGDDIFCVTADWVCNHIWKNKKPIFIGEELPKLSDNVKKRTIKNYWLRKFYEFLVLFKSDYIIYFGGSLFSKVGGIRDIKFLLGKYSFFHSKLGTIGTSVGPFKTKKDYSAIKFFLSNFKFISVRDYSSVETLSEMGIREPVSFSFDTAILIKRVYPSLNRKKSKIDKKKFKLAVSLCHYERYVGENTGNEKDREKFVFEFLDKIIKEYDGLEEVVFFEFNGSLDKGDLEISKEFINKFSDRINTKVVSYTIDTEKFIGELNKCDFLVGMRLHSGILAYTLELPFMLVEYHKKCTEFLNTINHNYRFNNLDQNENLKNFNTILENNNIPNIKKPKYFEDILIDRLEKINNEM